VPRYCIGVANIATAVVTGQAPSCESPGGCGQSLCGVPSGATPSLTAETFLRRRPPLVWPAFVVHDFAIGDISPVRAYPNAPFDSTLCVGLVSLWSTQRILTSEEEEQKLYVGGSATRLPRPTLESKIRALRINKSRLRARAPKRSDATLSRMSPLVKSRPVWHLSTPVNSVSFGWSSSCVLRTRAVAEGARWT
jgi:hypothetical protein